MKTIGENVRELRLKRNLTQADLAGLMDKHPSFVSAIERGKRGKRSPSDQTMGLLCDALGVDERTIRYGEEIAPEELQAAEYFALDDITRSIVDRVLHKMRGMSEADRWKYAAEVLDSLNKRGEKSPPAQITG
jgi:transcriptional regulator with XRE-family HTH domain